MLVAKSPKRRSVSASRSRSTRPARPTSPQVSGNAITDALTVAAGLTSAHNEQQRLSRSGEAVLAESPALVASRRAAEEAGTALLVKAGFELKAFERARIERAALTERAVDEQHADAVAQSVEEYRRLRSALAMRREIIESVFVVDPGTVANPPRILLNVPFMIAGTSGVTDQSSQIVPSNSSAKFRFQSSQAQGLAQMNFFYSWINPKQKFAVINANAYLVFSGHCTVHSEGGFFAGNRFSSLKIQGTVHPLLSGQDALVPMGISSPTQVVLTLSTTSGAMFDDDSNKSASVFRGVDLQEALLLVPPLGEVVFQVSAEVSFSNGEGRITADFASGDFQVISPAVLVTILTL